MDRAAPKPPAKNVPPNPGGAPLHVQRPTNWPEPQSIGLANTAHAEEQSGFILIYVAVLLVAISLILAQLSQMQAPSPLYMEKRIAYEIQRRETLLLLDFVIAGLQPQTAPVDPRFAQYQRILAASPRAPSELDDQIAWLKNMLAQFNFDIDTTRNEMQQPDKTAGESGKPDKPASVEVQGAMFAPQQEPTKIKLGDTSYSIHILPHGSLPNLNAIPYMALARYLNMLKVPEAEAKELAAAIIDWIDADGFKTDGIGAERDYYNGREPSYSPRNAPLQSWQELNYIRGVTPDLVNLLRDNFVLGKPDTPGVLTSHFSDEKLVALTGLKQITIASIREAYTSLGDKQASVGSILFSQDAAIFDRTLNANMEADMLRIRISSTDQTITADYDSKNQRLIAWW